MTTARDRLLDGLPLVERRARIAGVTTSILEGGEGRPMILLHGGIECGGAVWAPVVTPLAGTHRLIIPDVPGLGESEPLPSLDHPAFARWLVELMSLTTPERPILVAHSLLGSLAARFAAEHGDQLERLLIYGTPGIGPYRMPLELRVAAVRFAIRPSERNAERFERLAFFDLDGARSRAAEWFRAFSDYTRARAGVPHVKRTMRHLIGSCTKQIGDAELHRIPIVTELLWGRQDRFVPLSLGEATSARHGWPLRVIDRAGHVPHIERPDAFLAALSPALDSTTTRSQI
jgi:pimeloyl-ACP methyl ester carboxylesterase